MSLADKSFSRVADFLLILSDVEKRPTGPNEGYECCMIALETWAELGLVNMGQATINMHRRYFPNLGNSGRRAAAAALRGYSRNPPPIDSFTRKALIWAVVDDQKGPEYADKHFGSNQAVGLSRCYAASVLDMHPARRFGLGRSLAAITHKSRLARLLGGYLAVLGADVLGGMDIHTAVHSGSAHNLPVLGPILDLVEVGFVNDARPEMNRYMSVSEVCRMIGAFTAMDNVLMCSPPNERTYVMAPILAPIFNICRPVTVDPVQNSRIRETLETLNDRRLTRLYGNSVVSAGQPEPEVGGTHSAGEGSLRSDDGLRGAGDPVRPPVGQDDDDDESAHVATGGIEDVPLDGGGEGSPQLPGTPGGPDVPA